jgi:hypothetical protein
VGFELDLEDFLGVILRTVGVMGCRDTGWGSTLSSGSVLSWRG